LVHDTKTGKNVPNDHKPCQKAVNYTKWPYVIPNGHKIYQHFPIEGPPKFTKIGIFGLKTNHLAILTYIVSGKKETNIEKAGVDLINYFGRKFHQFFN
jgi:hypothetical protein